MKTVCISRGTSGKIIERQLPETWNDLSRSQLLAFARIAFDKSKSSEKQRIELMYHILNIPYREFFGLELTTVMELWDSMPFLSKEPFITKNIIKGFWLNGIYYLGPDSDFSNTKVLETGWWDKYYLDYCKSKNEWDLDQAIACMFRPVNFTKHLNPFHIYEDYRVTFNMASVESRAKKLKKLNPHLKNAIYLQFAGNRKAFELNYKEVYSLKERSTPTFGFLELIIDLAGPKFGDVEAVEKKNWTVVLSFLEISERRAKSNKPNTPDGNQTQVFT